MAPPEISGTRHRLLRGLIIMQVAVAFILANLAILFSASYEKMLAANAGIATDYVLSAELNLTDARYAKSDAQARFCELLAERAAALCGSWYHRAPPPISRWNGGPRASILANDEVFQCECASARHWCFRRLRRAISPPRTFLF